MTLTLAEAQTMAAAVQAAAEARALHPLAIVVLDAGGHDLVVLRSERAGFHRVGIARGKATSCLGMGLDGADLADRAKAAPAFYAALAATLNWDDRQDFDFASRGLIAGPAEPVIRGKTGQVIRDARLDRYLAAHKQFAGSSALGVPSAYLRNATAEVPGR